MAYNKFKKHQLTSDLPNVASFQDPSLINAWGIEHVNNTMWVSSYGLVSSYDKKGNLLSHVTLPNILSNIVQGTGIIHNKTGGFVITNGPNTASATILIASLKGVVYAYNYLVDPINALIMIDNSGLGSVYTGITIINNYLCVADHFNNRIDVFDANFVQVYTLPFQDLDVINPIPSDVSPYNIVTIKDYVYVIYVRQNNSNQISYISVFNNNGLFVKRFLSGHASNSYGFVRLTREFKKLRNKFLLGNSDGSINVYNKEGIKIGTLKDECGCKMEVYGLKAMVILNDDIYYASNPVSGYINVPLTAQHGLYGKIDYLF